MSHPGVRQTAKADRQTPQDHRCDPRAWPVERPDRIDEYEDPGPDQNGVRLHQTRSTRCPGHARPRRLLPTTTRPTDPEMTHGSGRGAIFRLLWSVSERMKPNSIPEDNTKGQSRSPPTASVRRPPQPCLLY